MDKELLKVLEAREQRWNMRKKLVEKQRSCIITITLCIPLKFRTDEEFWTLFLQFCRIFFKVLISTGHQVCFEGCMRNNDGPAFFISTKTDAEKIKKIAVEFEESTPGGRILDIDVMDSDGIPISRNDINLPPRKCFVCENPAMACVSRKLHSEEEIYFYVEQLKEQIINTMLKKFLESVECVLKNVENIDIITQEQANVTQEIARKLEQLQKVGKRLSEAGQKAVNHIG